MPLQWQPVQLPLGASQDESQAPFALPVPLLQSLKNARVLKTGEIRKRNGWQAGAMIGTGERVISVDDDVFTIAPRGIGGGVPIKLGCLNADDSRVDYQDGQHHSFFLSEVEVLERHNVIRDLLSGDGTGVLQSSCPDFCVVGSTRFAVVAWEAAVPATPLAAAQHVIFATVIDTVTREPVLPPRQISTATGNNSAPHVIQNTTTTAVVAYVRATSNEIRGVMFDTGTMTWGADTVITNDLNAAKPVFDACEFSNGGTSWFLIYRNTTPTVQVRKVTGVGIVGSTTLGEDANASAAGFACFADFNTNNLWLAWYDSTNGLRACIRQAAGLVTVVLANMTVEAATDSARQISWGPGIGSEMILCWTTNASVSLAGSGYGRKTTKFRTLSSGGALGTQRGFADVELISKLYTAANGYTYAAMLYDASDIDDTNVRGLRSLGNQVAFTMAICETSNDTAGDFYTSFRVAASWAIGEAGRARLYSTLGNFKQVVVDGVNEHWWMLGTEFDTTLIGATLYGRSGVDICRQRIDASNTPPIFATRIGRNVVFSGGTPSVWDGTALCEYGFLVPPENAKGTDGGVVGGTFLGPGTYGAQVVWEHRLATGDLEQSAPVLVRPDTTGSFGIAIAAAGSKMTVDLPTLNLTRKWDETSSGRGVIARVFRTEANGSLYYLEGDQKTSSGFAASITFPFVLSIPVIQSDATAITHRELYTTGDILPNFPPPALSFVFTHRNRLFGISAENRRQVVFTHDYVQGELPGWHPDLVIDVPDEAVALATLDEKLVILCKNGIYLISGNGPDRKGLNSDYDQPFRLNSPHGCVTAESVVSFPNGIIYQAPTGFCLIDRQTTITRIGGPVEDTVATYPFAHDAAVLPDKEWVYWAMTNNAQLSASTDGRTIVYDWRHNVWSVDQVGLPSEGSGFTFVTSLARTKAGLFATVRGAINILQEGSFQDPGPKWIFTSFKTAMFHLGSNQLFERARWLTLLGVRAGVHTLSINVTTYHHATSAGLVQNFIWQDADTNPLTNYALKMHLANQKGAFFQVEVFDSFDAGSPAILGDSAHFYGLVIEMGLKKTTPQMAQAGMR